ncbi:MAG: class D sortase [Clostridia bacterium]|nr:class D sortase [Clostridia bacterium]
MFLSDNQTSNKTKKSRLPEYLLTPVVFAFAIYALVVAIGFTVIGDIPTYLNMAFHDAASKFDDSGVHLDFTPAEDTGATSIPIEQVDFPKPGTVFGKIEIESCGISCKLLYGDDDRSLNIGAGQYIGSSIPGYGKTTLVAGHNTSYFKTLKNIAVGDKVKVTTTYGVYVYEVEARKVYDKNNMKAFDLAKQEENLVLYTCFRRNTSIGRVVDRLYVYCKLVSGPSIIK